MLVDDDPVFRLLVTRVARDLGCSERLALCDCLATADLREAERAADLWIVDVHLPDGTGPAWLERQRREGRRTPALLLSHSALEKPLADDLQPCAFQPKPTSLGELKQLMQGWYAGD